VQAKGVIITRISQGYSLRYIITEALIHYGDNGDRHIGVDTLLNQLRDLLMQSVNGRILENVEGDDMKPLHSHFIDAVMKSVKSGIKVE